MSIRFKFRSSVNFDSVAIDEGQPSISVADLRSKIVRHKNLNISQDSDLIFSDATTGSEYNDENFQIPSGSSVIIKRVPAGSLPSATVPKSSSEKFGMKDSNPVIPIGYLPLVAEMDNFDDFGVDLCPVPETALSDSDLELDKKNCISDEKPNYAVPRVGCQKLETSDLSEAIPKGPNHNAAEGYTPRTKVELDCKERMKLDKTVTANHPAVQNADLPSELKCSLCNTFFKDAVMIPCCQHSFCEKCIRAVLHEKARCPKCYSSKFRVEDLLPNLSLRQAIEHFLESQIHMSGADSALHKYAPDGESGIQAKDVSCAVSVLQREPNLPVSPSATEKGSNQIMAESFYKSRNKNNISLGRSGSHNSNLGANRDLKSVPLSHNFKQIDRERVRHAHHVDFQSGAENLEAVPDFQGESQPYDLPPILREEVDSSINQKKGLGVNTGGGDRSFMAARRYKKEDRTCYMCGSPYHFIRDCPAASSPHPMLQTGNTMYPGAMPGYASPFWNSTPFPPIRSYTNMYGNSGMMPFNSAMVPPPYAVPPYMPPMYGGSHAFRGYMGMGAMAPQVQHDAKHPIIHSDNFEVEDCEKKWNLSNEHRGRGQPCDDEDDYRDIRYHHNEPERSHSGKKSRVEREKSACYSEDSFTRRSQMKHRHDKYLDHDNHAVDERHEKSSRSTIIESDRSDRRPYHQERSNSGVEDMPHSSDRHSEDKLRHHHRSSKKQGKREQCGSDSSRGHHQTKIEKGVERKRIDCETEGSNRKHHSHSKSGLEANSSVDQKKQYKDKDPSHISRHSRHSAKPNSDDSYDRWRMASASDEEHGEGNRSHKRKRVH